MTRRAVLALAIAAFGLASLLSGCRSDNAPNMDTSIVGNWKLVQVSGIYSGVDLSGRTVEFTEDGKVTFYDTDKPVDSASYSTGMDSTVFSLDPVPVIYLGDELVYAYSLPDRDTLSLTADGFVISCRRI